MTARAVMVFALLLLTGASTAAQEPDTASYADAATAALVQLARARHLRQDTLVHDYRALVTTRMDASVGRSRFARMFPLLAHETTGQVTWRRPNDLRLEIQGVRAKSAFPESGADVTYERPWFVPRALGDSIRLMGLPETAALHPLALGAERYYRYAIVDSVIVSLPGRTIRAIAIRVEPKDLGPSVVAGDLWVDAVSADVVRLMVTFLGEYLWDLPDADATAKDSADTRRGNGWASRFITVQADLEYSLHDNQYWMPYRQLLSITVQVDILIRGALPVRALTTFREYEINIDPLLEFQVALDSTDELEGTGTRTACPSCADQEHQTSDERREVGYQRTGFWTGGRWEVAVPPRDSLSAYAWDDTLELNLDPADVQRIRETVETLARIGEQLPGDWVGRPGRSFAFDRFADIARFNRVQGLSVGLAYQVRPGPAFSSLRGTARFGTADRRLTGSVEWRRDGPGGAFQLSAFRSVLEVEPWTSGQSLGNSLNAVFAGHDDADYLLALGGGLSYYGYTGPLQDVELSLSAERHRSMSTRTGSAINDFFGGNGILAFNPAVLEGDYLRASVSPRIRIAQANLRVGVEALVGEGVVGGRAWADAQIPFSVMGRTGALSLKAGTTVGEQLAQLSFRIGGPQTVRGYGYGVLAGDLMWAAQLDLALRKSWLLSPVVFVDVGNVAPRSVADRAFREPLVGVGGGLSLLGGWARLNGSVGLNPSTDFRFDLLFGSPR